MKMMPCVFSHRLAYLLLLLPTIVVVWESSIDSDVVLRPNRLVCQAFSVGYHSPTSRFAGLVHRPDPGQPAGDSWQPFVSQSPRPPRTNHIRLNLVPSHFEHEISRAKKVSLSKRQVSRKGECLSSICMSAADLDETDKNEQENRSILRRAWSKTFGRASSLVKVLLKPARYLKSLLVSNKADETLVVETDVEDEGTYITHIDNLATVEDDGNEVESMVGVTPTGLETNAAIMTEQTPAAALQSQGETTTMTVKEEQESIDFGSVEDIMQKAQAVADIAKEAVMTSLQDLQVPLTPEEQMASATLEKDEIVLDTNTMEETAEEAVADLLLPGGERWAVSAPDNDLTGRWKIVVTNEFKQQYDDYLKNLGQPMLVRSIALSIISLTKEETKQSDEGRLLWIKGKTGNHIWERTLHSSGSDFADHVLDHEDFEHRRVPIITADSEEVEAEAWWEKEGKVHRSWLRGGKKYGGGDFESNRYLSDENTLVCKTVFHPKEGGRAKAQMTWTFQREE